MKKNYEKVAVFGTGSFKGRDYSLSDLKKIADINNRISYKPKIKLKHKNKQSVSSYGKMQNWTVNDAKGLLYVDLIDVDSNVAEKIDNGEFPGKSLEILHDVKLKSGEIVPNLVSALAILGHEIPALFEYEDVAEKFSLETEEGEETFSATSYSLLEFIEKPEGVEMPPELKEKLDKEAEKAIITEVKKEVKPDGEEVQKKEKESPVSQSNFDLVSFKKELMAELKSEFQLISKKTDELGSKVKNITDNKSRENDKLFIDSLVNAQEPQLSNAHVKSVFELLDMLPDEEDITVVKKSSFHLSNEPEYKDLVSDEIVSTKTLVKRLLKKILPKIDKFSLEEMAEGDQENITVSKHDLKTLGNDPTGVALYKKAIKLGLEKNIDTDTEDGLKKALQLARIS